VGQRIRYPRRVSPAEVERLLAAVRALKLAARRPSVTRAVDRARGAGDARRTLDVPGPFDGFSPPVAPETQYTTERQAAGGDWAAVQAVSRGVLSSARVAMIRRLASVDVLITLALVAAALALRLRYWGGYGLADDELFWIDVKHILLTGTLNPNNQAYRFTWWLPAAIFCRLFGMTEVAMVLPYLIYSLVGIALVYGFGRRLFGRFGGFAAGLMLVVHPTDVRWATLVSNDFAFSVFALLTFRAAFAATDEPDIGRRRWLWASSALCLWLCYHSKVTAPFLAVGLAGLGLTCRNRLAGLGWFFITALVLFGAGALVSYAFAGSILGPFQAELKFQGLLQAPPPGPGALRGWLLTWPLMLFVPDYLGNFYHAFFPHALVVLWLASWPLGLRNAPVLWWWLLPLLVGMELSFVRVNGYWVTGFRNFRHAHVFVYPIVLLVAGYLAALRPRARGVAPAMLAVLVVASLHEAVKTADVTHTAFDDGRAVCNFLAGQPGGTVYLDAVFSQRCATTREAQMGSWQVKVLPPDPPTRARLLAQAEPGAYAVTGGAREPVYVNTTFIPRAAELPPERFQSLLERGGPVSEAWRPEPLRIWRTEESARAVDH
jgi:hypothetical protein